MPKSSQKTGLFDTAKGCSETPVVNSVAVEWPEFLRIVCFLVAEEVSLYHCIIGIFCVYVSGGGRTDSGIYVMLSESWRGRTECMDLWDNAYKLCKLNPEGVIEYWIGCEPCQNFHPAKHEWYRWYNDTIFSLFPHYQWYRLYHPKRERYQKFTFCVIFGENTPKM